MKKMDIYIDEDKVNGVLGFLVIKNTPYFQQLLYNKRQKFNTYYEIHFKKLNNNSIGLSKSWLNLFLNFDTEHKNSNIENNLEVQLGISRIYHLDSKATDLLQLVDILLATSVRGSKGLLNDENFTRFGNKIKEGKYLTKGELKSYLSNYLYKCDKKGKIKK